MGHGRKLAKFSGEIGLTRIAKRNLTLPFNPGIRRLPSDENFAKSFPPTAIRLKKSLSIDRRIEGKGKLSGKL